MDVTFGEKNFKNEIVWKRTNNPKGHSSQGAKHFGRNNDSLLLYSATKKQYFNPLFRKYSDNEIRKKFNKKDEIGNFTLHPLDGPGGESKGNPKYEFTIKTR